MRKLERLGPDEAERIGDSLGVDWGQIDLEPFRMGLQVELERGSRSILAKDNRIELTGEYGGITSPKRTTHLASASPWHWRSP